MEQEQSTLAGGCLCGAVRFEIDMPPKWCGHCHCHLCRRAHGAPLVTWFGVDKEHFRFASDETLRWYRSTPEARRGFCSRCGSTMFFQSSRWPTEMHIALPYMDGDIGLPPKVHVYWDRKVEWLHLDDDLKKLGGETGVEEI